MIKLCVTCNPDFKVKDMKEELLTISPEQWDKFLVKYNNLMLKIAHMVTGDLMLCSIEDNLTELHMCAVEGIRGFNRLTGKSVDEMFTDPNFDKYVKTTLWHYKGRKGANLTKKMPFRNKFVSIHDADPNNEDTTFDIADTSGVASADKLGNEEFAKKFDGHTSKIVNAILSDPTIMDESGKVRPYSLKKLTGLSLNTIHSALKKIGIIAMKESYA